MQGGWFVGDFQPNVFKTKKFEVGYKIHKKGELWPKHYHRKATEINCLISGKMNLNQTTLQEGDIFVIEPGEAASPKFLEECCLIVIKVPGCKKDKYEVV